MVSGSDEKEDCKNGGRSGGGVVVEELEIRRVGHLMFIVSFLSWIFVLVSSIE